MHVLGNLSTSVRKLEVTDNFRGRGGGGNQMAENARKGRAAVRAIHGTEGGTIYKVSGPSVCSVCALCGRVVHLSVQWPRCLTSALCSARLSRDRVWLSTDSNLT